jgi:ACS family hexuronate transporter-like MFS transporter
VTLRLPHLRYIIAILLLLATTINYMDRLALSVVSPMLRREFGMGEQDYGEVIFFFLTAYAVMYAVSGVLIDRLGTRRGYALSVFAWSLIAMAHALVRGKWSLAACRFLLGAAEPGNWPAAGKAVAEWFPAHQRALGVGIFNAGTALGSAIASPVVAWLTLRYGWRAAFLWTGAAGLLWVLAWLLLYQPPHRSRWITAGEWDYLKDKVRPPEDTVAAPAPPGEWRRVLMQRESVALILARFFTDPVLYFVVFWLPEYLQKERNFDLAMVGRYAWVPFLVADVGYILGGWSAGWLMQHGWSLARTRRMILCCGAACMPAGIWATYVPGAGWAIALTSCMTFGHAVWSSSLIALPTDLFPGRRVATATGFSGMGGGIGGMIANLGTGYVVQRLSYRPIFTLAGLMHPLALVLVLWLIPVTRFADAQLAAQASPKSLPSL